MAAEVRAVAVTGDQRATRVTLTLSGPVEHAAFVLPDPDRLVIDLKDARWRVGAPPAPPPAPALVGAVRYAPFRPGVLRLVFEGRADLRVTGQRVLADGPGRALVIELAPRRALDARITAARGEPGKAPRAEADKTRDGKARDGKADAIRDGKTGPAKSTSLASVAAASTSRAGIARPDPASRRLVVVIDPGHGGEDPGAISDNGVHEKHVTLAAARALREELRRGGRYRVVLTRDRDVFVPLRRRIAIARAAGADLFISVHADKMENRSVRGLSIYTLSERASDAEAAALADRENKADLISGVDLSRESPEVANILIGLAQRYTMNRSAQLATAMVRELRADMMLLPKTHRFAGFAVLKAPDVPAVLIEMGYLSNPRDEAMLRDPAHRKKLARAIGRSVDGFFNDVERASLR